MTALGRIAVAALIVLLPNSRTVQALAPQDTLPPVLDTLVQRADSQQAAADSTARADSMMVLAIERPNVPNAPLPPGRRITLTRDSLLWSRAATLSDLLSEIPGVYVARAGFLGQPEYVQYGGRGGSALEVYWDGMPLEPLGSDTLFVDPGQISLSYLERIDIELTPGALRVYLVSERHEGLSPRSKVRVMSGPFETGAYAGLFQHRWRDGLGLDLAADFLGTEGVSGAGRTDQLFDVWAKLSWVPEGRIGASYQVRRHQVDRPQVDLGTSVGVPSEQGVRTDALFSIFAQETEHGLGFGAEGGLAVSSWSPDSGSAIGVEEVRRAYAGLEYERRNLAVSARAQVGDGRTTTRLEGRFGWVPFPGVVMESDLRWMRHEGNRTSRLAHMTAGVHGGPLSVSGEITLADAVQAPALVGDTAVATADRALHLSLRTRPFDLSASLVRRDAFEPLPYPDLALIRGLAPTPATTYLVGSLRLRPSAALTLGLWYSDPVDNVRRLGGEEQLVVPADLQPPAHARADITLRSKYWRTFRSGAFGFKLQLAMESWSTGTAGLDAQGVPITLPGATFYHVFVQFQVVSFRLFWDFRNARLTEAQYVPGLTYPRQAQTFGVTWEFLN